MVQKSKIKRPYQKFSYCCICKRVTILSLVSELDIRVAQGRNVLLLENHGPIKLNNHVGLTYKIYTFTFAIFKHHFLRSLVSGPNVKTT